MDNFLLFTSSLLTSVSTFLITPPISWFVGIFLVLTLFGLVRRICNL